MNKLIAFQAALATHVTVLNGLSESLPEPFRAQIAELKDKFNVILAGMQPTDQVPAANEANWALSHLEHAARYMLETQERMARLVAEFQSRAATVTAGLPEEITRAIDTKITNGELITKAAHDTAVNAAASAARSAAQDEARKVQARRADLIACGLPEPTPEILALDDAQFAAAKADGLARVLVLTEARLDPATPGNADLVFCAKPTFDLTMAAVKNATARAGIKIDPMAGNPGKSSGETPGKPAVLAC